MLSFGSDIILRLVWFVVCRRFCGSTFRRDAYVTIGRPTRIVTRQVVPPLMCVESPRPPWRVGVHP